jgi:DNA-directed RNA polymerase specialized sigma24 family protein
MARDFSDRLVELLPRMERAIRHTLYWLTRDDVADCLQEAYLSLLCSSQRERLEHGTDSYIISAAVFAARKHERRQRRQTHLSLSAVADTPAAMTTMDTSALWIVSALHTAGATTQRIGLGLLAGLRRGEACQVAGVSRPAFSYHRKKLAHLLAS